MKESEVKLLEGAQLIECSTTGIIHERFLEKYIKYEHMDSLRDITVRQKHDLTGSM